MVGKRDVGASDREAAGLFKFTDALGAKQITTRYLVGGNNQYTRKRRCAADSGIMRFTTISNQIDVL